MGGNTEDGHAQLDDLVDRRWGTLFTSVFCLTGGTAMVSDLVTASDLSSHQLVLVFLLIVFVLGALLDWVSVVLIAVPIFFPFLGPAGIDPVWFSVLVAIALQTSYLNPPMAPSIFYLRGIAPPSFARLAAPCSLGSFATLKINSHTASGQNCR